MIIGPNSTFKRVWSIILIIILVYTATLMPYKLALIKKNEGFWFYLDTLVDFLFMIDIYVNVNSPIPIRNDTFDYDRSRIFKNYLFGWLIVDIFASLPLDLLEKIILPSDLSFSNSDLIKIARLPRLYRLLRVARLIKLVKMFKKSILFQKLQDFFKLNTGAIRLASFFFTVAICVHLVGCLWILLANYQDYAPDTWVTM